MNRKSNTINEIDVIFVGGDPQVKREDMIFSLAEKYPYRKFLMFDTANKVEKTKNIVFRSRLSGIDFLDILKKASVLIIPGVRESCPYVLLEAMRYGVVCIAANKGGIPEIIKNKKNGFLFDSDSIDSLARVFDLVNSTDSHLEKIKNRAKYTIAKRFDIRSKIKVYENIISPIPTTVRLIPHFGSNNGVSTHGEYLRKFGSHQYSYETGNIVNSQACGAGLNYRGKIDVYTAHSYYGNEKGLFGIEMNEQILFNANRADRIIAVSNHVAGFLTSNGILKKKITIVPNGV